MLHFDTKFIQNEFDWSSNSGNVNVIDQMSSALNTELTDWGSKCSEQNKIRHDIKLLYSSETWKHIVPTIEDTNHKYFSFKLNGLAQEWPISFFVKMDLLALTPCKTCTKLLHDILILTSIITYIEFIVVRW